MLLLLAFSTERVITSRIKIFRAARCTPQSRMGPLAISGAQIRASRKGALLVLRGVPPWQMLPQPARREDDGKESGHAEREERPDKQEGSVGLGDRSADSRPLHVNDRDEQSKDRSDEDDNVPRSLSGQHQRSVQPDDQDWYRNEVRKRSWLHSPDDVVRQV